MTTSKVNPRPRMSRQRRAVLEDLAKHPIFRSAQAIHASVEGSGIPTSLATVYRNLNVLEKAGEVDALLSPSGEVLYRGCVGSAHHHHLICSSCGRTEEVRLEGMERGMDRLAQEHGYKLLDHTVELIGLCAECAEE